MFLGLFSKEEGVCPGARISLHAAAAGPTRMWFGKRLRTLQEELACHENMLPSYSTFQAKLSKSFASIQE